MYYLQFTFLTAFAIMCTWILRQLGADVEPFNFTTGIIASMALLLACKQDSKS